MGDPVRGELKGGQCAVTPCPRESNGYGYCDMHWDRLRRGSPLDAPCRIVDPNRSCAIEGCPSPHLARGYCHRHYMTETGAGVRICKIRRARQAGVPTRPFTDEQWAQKIAYYGWRCWICGDGSVPLEADHVKPLSKGGAHMLCNLRPACRSCNASKNAKWPFVAA